jgi:hypothetical protein
VRKAEIEIGPWESNMAMAVAIILRLPNPPGNAARSTQALKQASKAVKFVIEM